VTEVREVKVMKDKKFKLKAQKLAKDGVKVLKVVIFHPVCLHLELSSTSQLFSKVSCR